MSVLQNQSGTIPASTTGGPSTPLSIVSSTDATPIHVVVTPGQAWALDGETVRVEGHKTNTNANGEWQAAIVNSTEIVLLGSTGTGAGAGGATGVLYDYNTSPVAAMPNNGDLATGPSVATAVTAPLNCVPWLYERTGKYRLHNFLSGEILAAYGTAWSQDLTIAGGGIDVTMPTSGGVVAASGGPLVVYQGDLLHVRWSFSGVFTQGTTPATITLQLGISIDGGATYSGIGSAYRPARRLPQNLTDTSGTSVLAFAMTLEDVFAMWTGGYAPQTPAWVAAGSHAPTAGISVDFCVIARNYEASQTVAVKLMGDQAFSVAQLRSNA